MSSQLLRIFIDGDFTICLSDLFQCLTNLTVKKKKVFSCVEVKFCVLICSTCLLSCHLGTTENSLSLSYSLPPGVQNIAKIPLSHLLQAEQSQPSQPLLISNMLQSPLIIFVALCRTHSTKSVFLLYWGAQNWTQHFRCSLTGAESRGGTASLGPFGKAVLNYCSEAQPSLHAVTLCSQCSLKCVCYGRFFCEKSVVIPVLSVMQKGDTWRITR